MSDSPVIQQTRAWVESFVIGLNLCPFAKRELDKGRIRFTETAAASALELTTVLETELELLSGDDTVGTTLIVHPHVLTDFSDYLNYLHVADQTLRDKDLEGEIQIASFHPDYQFAGTALNDVSNMTNRSPFPMLHLIREDDVERAIEQHTDVGSIPERNVWLMNELGIDVLIKRYRPDLTST